MARQDAECETLVGKLGGIHDPTTDVYVDDDISAKGTAYRPGMESLLRAVQAGRYDGVVVWELPRFLRNKRESLIVREIMMSSACDLYNVRFPAVSLWGPTSIVFDVLVDAAVTEIETTAARISSWHRFMSTVGGARCRPPWGMTTTESTRYVTGRSAPLRIFAPDDQPRDELDGQSRAELVRHAAAVVLSGESVGSLVRRWNEATYPSPQGGWWSRTGMTKLLRNPTLAGYAHRAGVLLDASGDPIPVGSDEQPMRAGIPLLDEHTWLQLDRLLAARTVRRVSSNQSLLRGLVRCGRCGSNMVRNGGPKAAGGGYYVCTRSDQAGRVGCAGNAISARRLEPLVVTAVLEVLRDPELLTAAREANAPTIRQSIDALQTRLDRLYRRVDDVETLWLDTELKDARAKARFDIRRAEIEREIKQATATLAELTSRNSASRAAVLADAEDIDGAFDLLPIASRSMVIGELVDHLLIGPSRQGARFDPTRLTIAWNEA